jgi:hypothetical protein
MKISDSSFDHKSLGVLQLVEGMDAETKGVDGTIRLDPLASTKHIYVISLINRLGKNESQAPS